MYEGARIGTAAALQLGNKDYLMRLGAEVRAVGMKSPCSALQSVVLILGVRGRTEASACGCALHQRRPSGLLP